MKVFELGLDPGNFVETSQKIQGEIIKLSDQQKKLKKNNQTTSKTFVENGAALKSLKTDYNSLQKEIIDQNKQNIKTITLQKNINAELSKGNNTIREAENQTRKLNLAKKSLNVNNKEEKKLLDDINKRIDRNTDFIKENSSEIENQKINIGNYSGALDKVIPGLSGMIRGLQGAKEGLIAQTTAQKGTTAATGIGTKALRIFKIALAATGVGLLVVALGTLVTFFSKTQRGVDIVSKVMDGLSAAVSVVIDRLSAVGGALVKITQGDFSGAFTDLKGAVSGLGDEMKREIGIANDLADATVRVRDKEIGLIEVKANKAKQIEELRFKAKDELTDLKERADLLKQAGELEKSILEDELVIASEKARISQANLDLGESTRDQIEENAKLQANVTELETATLKKQRSIEAERQGLLKRGRGEDLKAYNTRKALQEKEDAEAEAKIAKEKSDAIQKENEELARLEAFDSRKRELENQLELANAASKEERAFIKAEQDFEKETLALEKLQLTVLEKQELEQLLEQEHQNILNQIKLDALEEYQDRLKTVNDAILQEDTKNAKAREDVANVLTGALIGLLGDSLGAKLAGIAIEGGIQAGLVAIQGASAGGKISASTASAVAQSVAASPLTFGQPWAGAAIASGAANLATSQAATSGAISKILGASALKGLGALATNKFSRGGTLVGASHSEGGIPFTINGKAGFEAEGGETIINKESSQMYSGLLSAINEAGGGVQFAEGGRFSDPSPDSSIGTSQTIRVVNVARDTIDVAQGEIEIENIATL